MTRILLGLVFVVLAATSTPAPAQQLPAAEAPPPPKRYRVEIIVFRYSDEVASGNELFVPDPPPPPPETGAVFTDENGIPTFGDRPDERPDLPQEDVEAPAEDEEPLVAPYPPEVRVLAREELELAEVHDKLELLDAYQPVLWSGWTQNAIDRRFSPDIPLWRLGDAPAGMDGSFQLYLGRYLHLVVQLTQTQAAGNDDEPARRFADRRSGFDAYAGTEPVRLRIDEDRIVKNGDLRYFDHPKFGVLAKVTRLDDEPGPDDDELVLPAGR